MDEALPAGAWGAESGHQVNSAHLDPKALKPVAAVILLLF